jgi:superoxide dismutase, Cu-Zn family
MEKRVWWLAASALALVGCTAERGMQPADAYGPPARTLAADVRDPGGITMARAAVSEMGDSIRVRIEAMGMRPGAYGAHVHAIGRCDPPDFNSAGPHWNPTGQKHGKNNPQGMHKGDLPNLAVGTDGRGSFEVTIPGVSVGGRPNALLDADGAAVVIHAAADDYRTDPSGNSGARIACGVLG